MQPPSDLRGASILNYFIYICMCLTVLCLSLFGSFDLCLMLLSLPPKWVLLSLSRARWRPSSPLTHRCLSPSLYFVETYIYIGNVLLFFPLNFIFIALNAQFHFFPRSTTVLAMCNGTHLLSNMACAPGEWRLRVHPERKITSVTGPPQLTHSLTPTHLTAPGSASPGKH